MMVGHDRIWIRATSSGVPFRAVVGFVVCWLVCFVEPGFCYTAYGGPFTVLMLFGMLFVFSGLAVGAALLVGLVLLLPGIRDLWRRAAYWSLLLSAIALGVMIFASKLGSERLIQFHSTR